jgi:UDP-N-acetyl-D-glucosamine dehydrogenase
MPWSREAERLRHRLTGRDAVVGVVGLGYVGLPLAVEQSRAGFTVLGLDDNADKVARVNRRESYIPDVPPEALADAVASGRLSATTQYGDLTSADVIVICVPTPLTPNKEPDLSYIMAVAERVRTIMRPGQLVVLESTTYPGTTEEVLRPILETSGLQLGREFFLAFSPERVDPGNPVYHTRNTPKLVGGVSEVCGELAQLFYSQSLERVIRVPSPAVAEMAKVFENTYRAVNIALVNEMALLCDRMGLDVWQVLDAAGTKPFGIQVFYPGPGVGGHCIPLDPFYLAWKAREYDFPTRFIELAGEINLRMPYFVVDKLQAALNVEKKALNGSHVLLLGVAYKRDSNDPRESPALKVLELLESRGAEVVYHDPEVPEVRPQAAFPRTLHAVPLTPERLQWADAVVITTDHTRVDYGMVLRYAPLVLDTRNALSNQGDALAGQGAARVVKL